jgi:hypothetical protein
MQTRRARCLAQLLARTQSFFVSRAGRPQRGVASALHCEPTLNISPETFPEIIAEMPLNAGKKLPIVQYLFEINENKVEGQKIYCIQ